VQTATSATSRAFRDAPPATRTSPHPAIVTGEARLAWKSPVGVSAAWEQAPRPRFGTRSEWTTSESAGRDCRLLDETNGLRHAARPGAHCSLGLTRSSSDELWPRSPWLKRAWRMLPKKLASPSGHVRHPLQTDERPRYAGPSHAPKRTRTSTRLSRTRPSTWRSGCQIRPMRPYRPERPRIWTHWTRWTIWMLPRMLPRPEQRRSARGTSLVDRRQGVRPASKQRASRHGRARPPAKRRDERRPDAARATDRRAGPRRPHEPGDRRAALPQPAHRGMAPTQGLRQARHPLPS
jgi:hypothetical protein